MDRCDDCPSPEGCPDGCTSGEFIIENHELESPSSFEVNSEVFGMPLEMILTNMVKDIETLMEAVNDLSEEFDSFSNKHAR